MNLSFIIKKPLITEKTIAAAKRGVFTFLVDPRANKQQITDAITQTYKVDVVGVRTTTKRNKSYRVGNTRIIKARTDSKKALVELKSGQHIDLFEIETTQE